MYLVSGQLWSQSFCQMPVITPCKKRKLTQQLGENKRPKQGNNRVWSITIGNSHTYTVYTLLLTVTGQRQPLRFTQSPPDPLPTSSLFFFFPTLHVTLCLSISLSLSIYKYPPPLTTLLHQKPKQTISTSSHSFSLSFSFCNKTKKEKQKAFVIFVNAKQRNEERVFQITLTFTF